MTHDRGRGARDSVGRHLHVRRYTHADAQSVWDLHTVALKATGALFPGPWDADFEDIEGTYLRPGGEFLVGEIDGRIVAMGALLPQDRKTAVIKRMRVHPEFQRKGLGQAVLDHLERTARMRGFTDLELDTTPQQLAAQQFYRKNGYVEVGRRSMGTFDQLLYRKHIEPSS